MTTTTLILKQVSSDTWALFKGETQVSSFIYGDSYYAHHCANAWISSWYNIVVMKGETHDFKDPLPRRDVQDSEESNPDPSVPS